MRKTIFYAIVCMFLTSCSASTMEQEAIATDTGTIHPTKTMDVPSSLQCCHLIEGAFGRILQDDPALRASIGCPTEGHPRVSPQAWEVQTISFQTFEHGAMLRVSEQGWYKLPLIYVLYKDGSFLSVPDNFDPASEPANGGETPPRNLFEPQMGFGKVWREEPGVREALGWATSKKVSGVGRFQNFHNGTMIWASQRQETFVLMRSTKSYTVIPSHTFETPAMGLPAGYETLILGNWLDRGQPQNGSAATHKFAFQDGGTITFHDCTGSYEWIGHDKILISADACTTPEIPTGLYELTLSPSGETLVLDQTYQLKYVGVGGDSQWDTEHGDYMLVKETEPRFSIYSTTESKKCYVQVDYTTKEQSECFILTKVVSKCAGGESPFVETQYQKIYAGDRLILRRFFNRTDP